MNVHECRLAILDAQANSPDVETALDRLAGLYLEAAGMVDAWRGMQDEIKAAIAEIFVETGQTSAETSAARVLISRPSVTVRYDAKSLDALCASSVDLAEILSPHRTESERAGTMMIRGKK